MDVDQGLTLGEIGRAVVRIERSVNELVQHHTNTRETQVQQGARLTQVEQYIAQFKAHEQWNARTAQADLARAASTNESISFKSLITLFLTVCAGVGAAVGAYFKFFTGD